MSEGHAATQTARRRKATPARLWSGALEEHRRSDVAALIKTRLQGPGVVVAGIPARIVGDTHESRAKFLQAFEAATKEPPSS